MATKKVKTYNEQLWEKEIRRLRQFIRRSEQRGFRYADNIIPEKPAKVTASSVKHLQKLKPSTLYGKAKYVDPQTGVTLTGEEGRALERSRASAKARNTDIGKGKSLPTYFRAPTALSADERAYKHEITRINAIIKRLSKRGYIFSDEIIPEKPRKITEKDLNRLRKITTKSSYRYAQYLDPETGNKVSGLKGRKLERSRAGKKAYQTRLRNEQLRELQKQEAEREKQAEIEAKRKSRTARKPESTESNLPEATYQIVENIREELSSWQPSPDWSDFFAETKRNDKNILQRMFEGAIRDFGEAAVAQRLEEHAMEVNALLQEILYGSGGKDGGQIQVDYARFSQIITGRGLTIDEAVDLAEEQEYLEDNEDLE